MANDDRVTRGEREAICRGLARIIGDYVGRAERSGEVEEILSDALYAVNALGRISPGMRDELSPLRDSIVKLAAGYDAEGES